MSLDDRNYSEKRDFIRMQVQTKAILEHAGQQYPALCLDLSSSGMQLEVDIALAVGDRIRVFIPSEHSALKGLEADAEVVRISAGRNGRHTLGLAILDMR
ncbi:PilZ domain-containing protein [Metapseudomonas lalkuanensis]|uniref:PilZ domain-containing protein n=1 Tax=Metapseudomonas lalkuanensis TaxID=2604832 RepID=A0A5J6QIR5_9GAMM|nr:PilZ domain-containing protein [Pseudomonas lalkuanensis]QEY62470.1 PilZ domain-containing protein [Pseudomonas lalkuanensis]UCO96237.1 PilZ domain-containing protein [Pseudomonas lalkuanensis]